VLFLLENALKILNSILLRIFSAIISFILSRLSPFSNKKALYFCPIFCPEKIFEIPFPKQLSKS
jgi:hypothetical protein